MSSEIFPSVNVVVSVDILERGKSYSVSFVGENDHIYRTVRDTREFYEVSLLRALRPFLSEESFVVDVGANVGNHSLYLAGQTGCRVLAIEPVSQANQILALNIVANNLNALVHHRTYALGSENGFAEIESIDLSNLGATRLVKSTKKDSIIVRTLDSLPEIASKKISLIKIDVEGMELEVLNGSRAVLMRDHPIISCECSSPDDFIAVEQFLSRFDYRAAECFNATATYVFIWRHWEGTTGYTPADFLADGVFRASETNHYQMVEIQKANRSLNSLRHRIDEGNK